MTVPSPLHASEKCVKENTSINTIQALLIILLWILKVCTGLETIMAQIAVSGKK